MTPIYISMPDASFRKGLARDYWETERLPPPATCYGFLLSLIGEFDRESHLGVRITSALLSKPKVSDILRTAWRMKNKQFAVGNSVNKTVVRQQVLTDLRLVVWIDSSQETQSPTLEQRVQEAMRNPESVERFGVLYFGESHNLVDIVKLLDTSCNPWQDVFLLRERGKMSLPVWVDHVGTTGTKLACGDIVRTAVIAPRLEEMPVISNV